MAEQLYVSYWLNGFTEQNMFRHYEKLLRTFPYSKLMRSETTFRVVPISFAEPPLLEKSYHPPVPLDDVLTAAKDFRHADSAYRLETWWDLWQHDTDWKVMPARVSLDCFGPEFDRDFGEDLRIEFGIDTHFLPQPELPGGYHMTQSNIRSLLKLVHDLDDTLNASRRQLWTESGENFAERLQETLSSEK